MKVTVVATGLGADEVPKIAVDNTVAQQAFDGQVDYNHLDRPAFARNQAVATERDDQPERGLMDDPENADMDYLDIPAFLRRQAD